MSYAQVITRGFAIGLEVGGQDYRVHVGGERAAVCPGPPRAGEPQTRTSPIFGLLERARSDLAERLDVPETGIRVISLERKTWPDSSLGCAEPGKTYRPGEVKGFLLELEVDERVYRYHAQGERIFLCESPAKAVGQQPHEPD